MDDFYEDDEPLADVLAAYEAGMMIWTVYDHPLDRPDMYVTRAFQIRPGSEPIPTGDTFAAVTLELVRAWIRRVAPGSVCLTRQPEDDPVIIENWL